MNDLVIGDREQFPATASCFYFAIGSASLTVDMVKRYGRMGNRDAEARGKS